MVNETRTRPRRRRGQRKIKFFYLDGDLHQILTIIKPSDLVVAWNFPKKQRKGYVWSDVQRRMQNAYTTSQVAKMLGRSFWTVDDYIREGVIPTPQRRHKLDAEYSPSLYMFSEDDVLGLHDYLLTQHVGRPRKDGLIRPKPMPNRAELRAMMRHDTVMYVKNDEEEFIPLWREPDW